MAGTRSNVVSSFTIVKGSLIHETLSVFQGWNHAETKRENLRHVREDNSIGASSLNWARDVAKVINRRFEPAGRDRALVVLANSGCSLEVWKPALLYHMTRDEFLVRDFLINWLYPQYTQGAFRLHTSDVVRYLGTLGARKDLEWSGSWTTPTTERVATGLLRIASDFDLLRGKQHKEFASYHLPEAAFLYLLHAMATVESNARRVIEAQDWRMYLMDADDVEREVLRLHQFRKLHYEAAGSLAQLQLPASSLESYVEQLAFEGGACA